MDFHESVQYEQNVTGKFSTICSQILNLATRKMTENSI